jgi:glutaredoxin
MQKTVLYVASRNASSGGSPNAPPVYFNSMNFPAGSSGSPRDFIILKPEDQEAIGILRKNGITFKIVDLSQSTHVKRFVLKISGMRTPTLIINDKKLVGLENIKKVMEERRTF